MTLKKITIENVKGIEVKTFDLDIIPNKPSLLVAPNGFGKSSIVAAFSCLQLNRINLHEDHYYQGDPNRHPKLKLEYLDDGGTIHSLEANATTNTISNHFDWFVINCQMKAKGVGRTFGGRTHVSASMEIEPIVLVDTIPRRERFDYSYADQKQLFGLNGKMLPNIGIFFDNLPFIATLSTYFSMFDRVLGVRVQASINQFKQEANGQTGSAAVLRSWMATKKLGTLDAITQLKTMAELLLNSNLDLPSREVAYLTALQMIQLYATNKTKFKNACKFSNYKLDRKQYTDMLTAFDSSWCDITPREGGGKLVVTFPKLQHISNGERDVLSFLALLLRARKTLKNRNCILLIDEVFDYLDDANLVAVQYYITQFIEEYRQNGKKIYPLIFTHLNPYYFKNFAFSKQKVYFLNKSSIKPNQNLIKLLRKRENASIQEDVSKYLFHYHTSNISKRNEFLTLTLKETWGESDNFDRFLKQEIDKYLNGQAQYDPLAICCAVRKRVEKLIFDQLNTPLKKTTFLDKHKTSEKLAYAEDAGLVVPEYYYLLGIIYNDGMHWRENQDNISPIAAKLENHAIKNLIGKLYY